MPEQGCKPVAKPCVARHVQQIVDMTTPTNAEQLTSLLGEVDPTAVARLLAIGASYDEVAEALSSIEDEDAYGELHHLPSSPKVAEARAVLEELVLDHTDDEDSMTETAGGGR
jgi:hypothetical protein